MKDRGRVVYPNKSPWVKYKQKYERNCSFRSLEYDFDAIGGFYLEESVSNIIKE